MAIQRLDFLNKNMYRKYPIRSTSRHIFTNGVVLPQSLITSIQVTTLYTYSKIFISQIYANNGFINITLQDLTSNLILGCFSGQITSDQQVLLFQPFCDVATGSITIGSVDAVNQLSGMNMLTSIDGRLEDSTVYCFIQPGVTTINNNGNTAVGLINLAVNNISLVENTSSIELDVIDVSQILSNNSVSALYNNCNTPLIRQINSVVPDVNGNIDVFGIAPVVVSVSGAVTLSLGSLTLTDVCPERALLTPPNNSSDVYYDNILTTTLAEWQTWPQYT